VGGVFLTTLGQSSGSISWPGFLLLLGAVLSAALFNVLSRKFSGEFCSFERTYVMFAMGFAVYLVAALIACRNDLAGELIAPLASGALWSSVLYLSALASVGAFLMLNYALTYLETAKTSIFANLTTVISIAAGVLLLHESFGLWQIAGSVVILLCVYGVNRPARQRESPRSPDSAA
jgi:drug/metabolite transporter (DMT)-like permease